jgi:hypothetical protein
MKLVFLTFAFVYLVICSACLLVPTQLIADNLGFLWLLCPPSSLVYGTKFLWPFGIGTGLIVVLLYAVVRAETPFLRGVVGLVFAAVWALAGFVAYAPGA